MVTVCFLGLFIAEVVADVEGFSSEKVSSRSSRLNAADESASPHTVDVTLDASSLFQKNGLSRLAGRTILGIPNLKAPIGGGPGDGGIPGGGGGGGGTPGNEGGGGGGGGEGGDVASSKVGGGRGGGGGGGGGGREEDSSPLMRRTGAGGGGGGSGGDVWVSETGLRVRTGGGGGGGGGGGAGFSDVISGRFVARVGLRLAGGGGGGGTLVLNSCSEANFGLESSSAFKFITSASRAAIRPSFLVRLSIACEATVCASSSASPLSSSREWNLE